MQVFSITATGTGNQQYLGLNFLPSSIIFYGGSIGSNPNVVQRTFLGASDGTNHRGTAAYGDSTGRKSDRDTTYDIIVLNRNTNIDRVFEGSVVSFDNVGGVYGFTLNQNTNTVNPVIYGIAFP